MTDFTYPKETTMTTKQYTAEDFANAEFARHPDGDIAARFARFDYLANTPWRVTNGLWLSDADMAANDWVPVREATAQPITLEALHEEWENAEQAERCEKGDVLIYRSAGGMIEVWVTVWAGPLTIATRILRRAPKPPRPEGAERLDAMLRALVGNPALLADWLAERGVRVTEGGDK